MKKTLVSLGRILFVLLLLTGLSVCTMSDQSEGTPPEDAVSFDQLLTSLDELQGPAVQSPSAPGKSVFSLPDGSLLSSADLSAYINAIKRDLAAYIYSCAGGRPYLVTARTLVWDTDPGDAYVPESGLMWVPITWWGRWISTPVISYQHGTQVYRECAPSKFNANPLAILASPDLTGALQNYVECIVGALMATAGYTVVMPDYTGFGSSQAIHPYVHHSLGNSVVGALGAARAALASRRVTPQPGLFLTGYSEGGYTTMAGARALQLAGQAATGIVACAGPYSLSGVMLAQMLSMAPITSPHYLLYTTSGYLAAEPTMPAPDILLNFPWAYLVAEGLFNGSHTNAEVSAVVPTDVPPGSMLTSYAKTDLLVPGGTVYQLLVANNAWQGWIPTCPLAFVHCEDDDVVPYANAEIAQEYYADTYGVTVPIVTVAAIPFLESVMGTTHTAAYPPAMLAAFRLIRGDY